MPPGIFNEQLWKVALSMTKGVTSALLLRIDESGIDWKEIFTGSITRVCSSVGMNPPYPGELDLQEGLAAAEKELSFMKRHSVKALFILDDDYPQRLVESHDPPVILYVLGQADMNPNKSISIVGTRKPTPWGMENTVGLVKGISDNFPDASVVSGLAYGIDTIAHESSLKNGISTVAVLAHGLDMIYPASNRALAAEIIGKGGALVTEYPIGTKPYRPRFLERNRIIAALSDVTIVVESDIRGGALSTARCADEYNREVMAIPGRPGDNMSMGCNALIRKQRASMLRDVDDLVEQTGWVPSGMYAHSEKSLFPELDGEGRVIYDLLAMSVEPLSMDVICQKTGIPIVRLMPLLSELEFESILTRIPGNRFLLIR